MLASNNDQRLALLGFHHEANSFAPRLAQYSDFEVLRGDQIVQHYAGSSATVGGFLAAGDETAIDIVPLVFANATPMGPITSEAYESLTSELLEALDAGGPWDGVLVAQHGAATSTYEVAADEAFLRQVRAKVGPRVPIGVALDLHANLSPTVAGVADIVTTYRTNPHLDAADRALTCARLVIAAARSKTTPVQAIVPIPLAINVLQQDSSRDPLRGVLTVAEHEARGQGVLTADFVVGHPYVDAPDMGAAAVVVHSFSAEAAAGAARRIALAAWQCRAEFQGEATPVQIAVELAKVAGPSLLVLLDVGDNIGGGSPGDSTTILEALLAARLDGVLATLCDAHAVRLLEGAGVGRTLSLELGGKHDVGSKEMRVEATVLNLADGHFEEAGPTHGGFRIFDSGPVAVVRVAGATILISSKPVMMISRAQFESAGIDPSSFRVAIGKGVHSPRPLFAPYRPSFVTVDSPGCTAAAFTRFHFEHRRRPLFPFEPDAKFVP